MAALVWIGSLLWIGTVCHRGGGGGTGAGGGRATVDDEHPMTELAFETSKLQELDHLVVVCGHGVVVAESLADVGVEDAAWLLLPYQLDQSLPGAFVSHIERGVSIAANDPGVLLVFSGGQTRSNAGPRSEGLSYWLVGEHFQWWGQAKSVRKRAFVEEYARDSFENLLFSIARFREVTGQYPRRFTVVGYDFKKTRFQHLHRGALRIPEAAFVYEGIQPPPGSHFDLTSATEGELTNAVLLFQKDSYGCNDEVLRTKRLGRNPFGRTIPYSLSCPEIIGLLNWCGPELYPGRLPWLS